MTTIKSTIGWLFGIYRDSFLLQIILVGVLAVHIGALLGAYIIWLTHFIAKVLA